MVNAQLGIQYDLSQRLNNIEAQLRALSTQPILLHASTGQDGGMGLTTDKNGLHVYNPAGVEVARLETSDGALAMFDTDNNEIARYGLLTHTAAGTYGAEVLVSGTWVQLGAQTSTWGTISGKPSTYNPTNFKWAPDAHTHPGADVTSRVDAATDAIGSQSGWTNNVGGTSYYALWVGNDATYSLGKNTSSIRYKTNVTSHYTDPANVLKLVPVTYQRASSGTTEFGLIAEQVAEHFPELVQWFDGQIDNVRYDLLSVALLSVVKSQDARIEALEAAMKTLVSTYSAPAPSPVAPQNTACNNPPTVIPTPAPYTIQPQGATA